MSEESQAPVKAQPAAQPAAKKPKEPTIEDKPFPEFIEKHFLPALQQALSKEERSDVELTFKKEPIALAQTNLEKSCSQVIGRFDSGRQFNLYFLDEDISGKKAFSYSRGGEKPSTLESFMIDERKINLDLLLMYTLQRLNAQKWLTRN